MDEPAQPSDFDAENFLTKEELIKQLELSGVNLGDDPAIRIDVYVNAGLLPIPTAGRFPTWTVQRILAIENKLAAGESLKEIQKEVSQERRRFLSGAKDLNSLVALYRKLQKNSAFFLFSFLLLFTLSMGVVASGIVAPGNPVVVAGQNTVRAVAEGAGKVAKVAAAPVGKTLVVLIQASKPEDSKSADPLNLTNIEAANPVASADLVQLDSSGNIAINGKITAASFSGSGENLTDLPASEVVGELELATLPWASVKGRPPVLTIADINITSESGAINLVAGTGTSILSDDTLDTITITNNDLGSLQAIFKNIAAAGQSTLVADANDDTLTLIAGANLVITTDAGGDSITFSVTGTVANADTLDLLDSTQFLRSDTSDNYTSGTLTFDAGTTLSVLGAFTCTNCIGDAAVTNGLTIDATGSVNAGAISSGTLGAAVVTLALGSFGSITGSLGDANVADTITATNYLLLAGGTMAGNIDLATNLLLNIGNAGTDFTAGGGLTLAGTETLSSLSISSGSRVANTITFNPTAGGSQYGYNLAITNAPTITANTAYGLYVSQSDTTTLANTNYGVYSTVTHTGPTAGNIYTYGGFFLATGDTGGTSSSAYGVYGAASGAGYTYGVYGLGGLYGAFGSGGTAGVYGSGGTTGVLAAGTTYGVYAAGGPYGVYAAGTTYGVYSNGSGAQTAAIYSGYFSNTATSSTAGINKYGLYITSTGVWNGAGSANFGIYLTDTTGGTNNYPIYQAGTTGSNVFTANSIFGRAPSGNDTLYGAVIQGALCVDDSTANCPAAPTAGAIYVENSVGAGNVSAFDISEYYPATSPTEKGDLVAVAGNSSVTKSIEAYDPGIIGIVSSDPAVVIDETNIAFGKTAGDKFDPLKPYVALAGRVPVKVSTENGDIEPGDALTSSSIPGVAMKATKSGPIVGKALEAYSVSGIGKIMVFVSVGWFVQPVTSDQSPVTSIDVETLAAGSVATQVLFVGERKISMAAGGALEIEGDVKITGDVIAKRVKTDELVVSEKSSGSANLKAGAKEITIENPLVKETSKVFIAFTADYSPATRIWVTKEPGKSFTVHLDQPAAKEATFDWLIIN